MKEVFYAKKTEETFRLESKSKFQSYTDNLKEGRYKLTVERFYNKRSDPQNKYWWGVVVPYVLDGLRAAGYNDVKTNEDAHEVLKYIFLKRKIKSEKDENEIIITGSTANLNRLEFMNLIDDVAQWCAEYLNFQLPMPGEQSILFASYNQDLKATIIEQC